MVFATFCFTLQIYCDFSGYSDIAIGTARLFGINLMTNFNSPYFSSSIREFWSRWHISLSTWFRDYVYIPLGGNRKGRLRRNINTFITFLLSGLWHGANMTFVLWGIVHGVGRFFENIFDIKTEKKGNAVHLFRIILVFVFCALAWVLFRANSLSDAMYVYIHMFDGIGSPIKYAALSFSEIDLGKFDFLFFLIVIIILSVHDYWVLKTERGDDIICIDGFPKTIRIGLYYMLIIMCIYALLQNAGSNQFVYFQF